MILKSTCLRFDVDSENDNGEGILVPVGTTCVNNNNNRDSEFRTNDNEVTISAPPTLFINDFMKMYA